jgi:DNA-directed RNA polymerase sigma subunit (sigma70/sigma32)
MNEKRRHGSLRWIAKELGISVDAVRGALNRAYYKLRKDPAVYALLRDYLELDTEHRGVWRRKA